MKIKTPPQVTNLTLQSHVQAITDDIRGILKGGLSIIDSQLPFQFQTKTVTSGAPLILSIPSPYTVVGCIPIQTNGSTILSFKTNLSNGILTVTVTLDVTNSNIVFLVIGA